MLQVLFIQGGGAVVHDQWDDKLADSLRRELGDGFEVRYPRMPDEDEPSFARWSAAIRREVAGLGKRAVVIGHSIGGAILMGALADVSNNFPPLDGEGQGRGESRAPLGRRRHHPVPTSPIEGEEPRLAAIILVAAPFVGEGGWPGDDFELSGDLGTRLPRGVPVHIFHGLDDDTAPPSHADLYVHVIPQAEVHKLPGRDHQLGNDLSEVARVIREIRPLSPQSAQALLSGGELTRPPR